MQIHLSDITDSEGKIIQFSSEVELDKISFQMGEFPILDRSPVELRIANTGNKVLELTGKGSLTVGIPCDRCLEEVPTTFHIDINKEIPLEETPDVDEEKLEAKDYMLGFHLDLDRIIYDEVLVYSAIFFLSTPSISAPTTVPTASAARYISGLPTTGNTKIPP